MRLISTGVRENICIHFLSDPYIGIRQTIFSTILNRLVFVDGEQRFFSFSNLIFAGHSAVNDDLHYIHSTCDSREPAVIALRPVSRLKTTFFNGRFFFLHIDSQRAIQRYCYTVFLQSIRNKFPGRTSCVIRQ